jgi:hypothetical protein
MIEYLLKINDKYKKNKVNSAVIQAEFYASKEKKGIKNTKQIKKYLSYNLPVLLIVRHEEIEINITKLKLFLKKKI